MTRHTGPTTATRELVLHRSTYRCERCSDEVWAGFHIHHRRPRGMGGTSREDTNHPSNLLVVCPACHTWIEANRLAALELGYLVRQHDNPATVPVVTPWGRVLLTADGRYEEAP